MTIKALPLNSAFVDVSDITVPIGATQASIWIGVPSSASTETVYIEWQIVGDTLNRFWVIRPLGVNIVQGNFLVWLIIYQVQDKRKYLLMRSCMYQQEEEQDPVM